jgi:hypothetical protein
LCPVITTPFPSAFVSKPGNTDDLGNAGNADSSDGSSGDAGNFGNLGVAGPVPHPASTKPITSTMPINPEQMFFFLILPSCR